MAELEMTWEQAVIWLRNQPDQHDLVRACFFDDPLLASAQRYHSCSEWRACRTLIGPARGTALDAGAGRGIASYALARDGWTVSALEPDPSDLVGAGAIRALSAESGLPIEVREEWGEALPFDTARFDVVLCRQVLHHAKDLNAFCREVARVLKPGGTMIATREHVLSSMEDLPSFLASHPLHSLYGGEHAFLLSDYHDALTGAGLIITASLNPLTSNINLFPMNIEDHRAILAKRFWLPKWLIGDRVMRWVGDRMTFPGRLYSFVAMKPEEPN
jgi:2-polyprenyl-3-methyl-5-hydroxy-6-metoxy-1,4-benzoquinol methylase